MKKLKTFAYYTFLIIFEEIVFLCIIFKKIPLNIWLIIPFSVSFAAVFTTISMLFKPKANKILTYIFSTFIFLIFGAQIVYYSMYEAIISFYSIVHGRSSCGIYGYNY